MAGPANPRWSGKIGAFTEDTVLSLATAEPGLATVRSAATRVRPRGLLYPALLAAACFALALATRMHGLHLAITTDEGFWVQRTVRFGTAPANGDFEGTYRSGHPGVTVTWLGLLGAGSERVAALSSHRYLEYDRLERAPGYLQLLAAARTVITITTAALTALIVMLAWKLLGPGPGPIGGLLLLLDRYLVGSSRLLHADALLAPLMTVSALAGLIYWTGGRRRRYLALSAVAGGLALLTKSPAVYVALYFGLVGLVAARPCILANPRLLVERCELP